MWLHAFFHFRYLPFNPNRIRDERSRRVVDRLCARDRDGLTQHGFQTIHSSLLRVYFDGENGMTVIIACLANSLIIGDSHEIRTVIEGSGRRDEDKGENDDADHIVLNGSPLKRP